MRRNRNGWPTPSRPIMSGNKETLRTTNRSHTATDVTSRPSTAEWARRPAARVAGEGARCNRRSVGTPAPAAALESPCPAAGRFHGHARLGQRDGPTPGDTATLAPQLGASRSTDHEGKLGLRLPHWARTALTVAGRTATPGGNAGSTPLHPPLGERSSSSSFDSRSFIPAPPERVATVTFDLLTQRVQPCRSCRR